jgi:hypothetical protein
MTTKLREEDKPDDTHYQQLMRALIGIIKEETGASRLPHTEAVFTLIDHIIDERIR